ncbi:MAG: hypothetical protein JXL67_05250, partial [Calditrichaeota bacterium]|nr:hypothetical protein [Calditrichota bacterium]
QEATDTGLEGTFVEVSGEVTDFAQDIGGAANIRLDDGSGECLIRVWNSTGVNLAGVTVGEQLTVRGPLDIYQGNTQLLLAYQEDLSKPGDGVEGDGSGFAVTEPDSVEIGASGLSVNVTLWSTQEDTLRTVHILMPVGWGWTALAEDVVLAGSGLASARQQVVSDFGEYRIELTDCFITGSDTGLVTITGLTSPLESVISYFWIKTAVQGGSPAFIDTSPVIMVGDNPMLQIRDVQVNSAQFTSPVTIRGLVTVGAGILRTDRTSAYIQDESEYGINISQFGPPDQRFQRGFYVEVTGTVSEYRETTQMTPSGVSIIDSSAQLPAAIAVSTGDANHPRWDGTYIRVPRNVGEEHAVVIDKYTTSTQPPFDYNIVVNDGSGALTLRVWGTTGINLDSVLVNEAVIASGVGSVFLIDNEPSYQILPAYQSDIIPDEGYEPSLQGVDLDIPPYPFVPDRGEKILIRYNAGAVNNQVTVRIFDLGGRMITTLVDKPAELIVETIEWDGRDKLLDFVPVGTYICHLEVMEFVSGKKETRMAPIVIGTILK